MNFIAIDVSEVSQEERPEKSRKTNLNREKEIEREREKCRRKTEKSRGEKEIFDESP